MKRILTPILLLTFLFPSLAYGETMDDLVYRDGLYYKKFSNVPFSGKITGRYQGSFKDGKKHGPWVIYHFNGQLQTETNWKNGYRDGVRKDYTKNGFLRSRRTYKNGDLEGPLYGYYENGRLRIKQTFKNGLWEGPWVEYWGNGQLMVKGQMEMGNRVGPWVYYEEDGTIDKRQTGTYKNDVKVSD